MANNLEFKISAEDQASRVVETVQHKINNFGKDVAKMALGVAGPMALIQAGFGLITSAIEKARMEAEALKKAQEDAAKESAARVTDREAGGSTVKVQKIDAFDILNKQAQLQQKYFDDWDKNEAKKVAATEYWLNNTEQGLRMLERDPTNAKIQSIALDSARIEAERINKQRQAAQDKIDAEKKALDLQKQQTKEAKDKAELEQRITSDANKRNSDEASRKREIKDAQKSITDAERALELAKQKSITVSSLREIGGGLSGESAGIMSQLSAGYSSEQQAAISAAKDQLDAANQNMKIVEKFGTHVETFGKSIISISQTTSPNSNAFINPGIDTTK